MLHTGRTPCDKKMQTRWGNIELGRLPANGIH